MRILDVNDVEIPESEVDLEKGYLEPDTVVKEHHEAVEEQPEENHLEVSKFYFDDGTFYEPTGLDDPHVEAINPESGVFDYVNLPGEEEKRLFGTDIKQVIDKEAVQPVEAWDETEEIQRYKLYTSEELEQKRQEEEAEKLRQEEEEKQKEFLTTAPGRLDNVEYIQDEMVLAFADILGGNE